ncbi:GFA family protein [Parerythrobacter aurantius]|uniref:GFA family protein n=1 Tax=Parerythrobacter aurantius TaxID=3127706 RepID=UPI00324691E6
MSEMSGGCLCGQVRFVASAEPVMQANCHCKNCQRQSGSAFSTIIGIPEAALSVEGEVKAFADSGESGQPVVREFCPDCGSPLFSKVAAAPGLVFIKAGTLDDTSAFAPSMHLWTRSKQAWVDVGGQLAFETNPG